MTKTASRAPDLLHGPVFSNMTRFFLPIMLGSLLQQLYSMVDAVVLGRLVGKTALAAVGGSDLVIINLVVGFFVGLSSGACVVVSQHYGAGERDMVRKSVHTAILFSVVIGAVMTALGIGMARTRPARPARRHAGRFHCLSAMVFCRYDSLHGL